MDTAVELETTCCVTFHSNPRGTHSNTTKSLWMVRFGAPSQGHRRPIEVRIAVQSTQSNGRTPHLFDSLSLFREKTGPPQREFVCQCRTSDRTSEMRSWLAHLCSPPTVSNITGCSECFWRIRVSILGRHAGCRVHRGQKWTLQVFKALPSHCESGRGPHECLANLWRPPWAPQRWFW